MYHSKPDVSLSLNKWRNITLALPVLQGAALRVTVPAYPVLVQKRDAYFPLTATIHVKDAFDYKKYVSESQSGQEFEQNMPVIPGKSATYDYVVIGGGTAGLTIATRLAQDSSLSVAIVEAVGFYEVDGGNVSVVPFYGSQGTSNPLLNWQFMTTPQPSLLNQTYHYARGKTLGGSSALNFMIYQRATVDSLQKWADEIDDQSYT